ncbi:peptidase M14 [Roseococcus sp. YIM B11640]|uniref:peptidase M14 n=1 Tax=Roseococcus sp. YIM B11640 TaxID=3133973 RepID=UPI003C7B02AC
MRDAGAPRQTLRLRTPDIRPWLEGNAGPGIWSFGSGVKGPHVCIVGVTHGNEIAGAVVLDNFLRAGLRPSRGRLSLVFGNLEAFSRFDPDDPTVTRFLDEDLNRVWAPELLDGKRDSSELRRARQIRPVLDTADVVLDLHSMLWPSDPLTLTNGLPRALDLATALAEPMLVVADQGHEAGKRIVDYGRFAAPGGTGRALLIEAGWHWEPETVARMDRIARRLLALTSVVPAPLAPLQPPRIAHVTETVTARGRDFIFAKPWRGGAVVPERGTLIAHDDGREIRTPHDDCVLVMPMLLTQPGQTAIRFARL